MNIFKKIRSIVLSFISGLIFLAGMHVDGASLLLITAFIPLVFIIKTEKPLKVFLYAIIAFAIAYIWVLPSQSPVIPLKVVLGFYFLILILLAGVCFISSLLIKKIPKILWLFILPSGVVLIEWLAIIIDLGLKTFPLSIFTMSLPWLRFPAVAGGSSLVTFLIVLLGVGFSEILEKPHNYRKPVLFSSIFIFCSILIFGQLYTTQIKRNKNPDSISMVMPTSESGSIRAACVNRIIPDEFIGMNGLIDDEDLRMEAELSQETRSFYETMMADYEVLFRQAAAAGARIISGPELALFVPEYLLSDFCSRISSLAVELEVTIVQGFWENHTPANSALIALADGTIDVVSKSHLVWGRERNYRVPGNLISPVFKASNVPFSVKICYDATLPYAFQVLSQNGARIMVLPVLCWSTTALNSMQMQTLRGMENSMALVRCDRTGFSSITDPYGNILAQGSPNEDGITFLIADIPLSGGPTLYSYAGDWIYIAAALVYLSAFLVIILRKFNISLGGILT